MSKTLIVNSIPFEYPEQGEQQPWGESATAWASEVTDLLNFVVGANDKLESAAEIKEIQASFLDISGLIFPSNLVRSFILTGSISRQYNSPAPFSLSESFTLNGIYDDSTATWTIQKESNGETFVSFDIDSSGQIKYKSDSIIAQYITVTPAWNSATAYVVGNLVVSSGILYRCIQNNTNLIPASNPAQWAVYSGYSGLLKYKASTLTKT